MDNVFAKYIKTNEITFKYAKGMRDIIGKEIHTFHEIFFYIHGNAEFITETGREKLMPYTTVIIPKETFHQFVHLGEEKDYCRCVFNFESVSELDPLIDLKFHKAFLLHDEEISNIFFELRDLVVSPLSKLETNILMKSLFAKILVLLKEQDIDTSSLQLPFNPITKQAIKYISRNINQKITVADLADELNVSASYLAHVFKNDLNISIHKYILEKRLILANKKIKESINTTQAATECGFKDYPNFYRQYKKMFGIAPSMSKHVDLQ